MSNSSLLERLAQPRSLAAIFVAIGSVVAVSAIPAEARRHHSQHRHVAYHAWHHHFAQHRHLAHGSAGAGDEIIGEHRGFAAIVVDGNSGRTLYARNEHDLRHPASVTKVMTLYLLFEQIEKGRLRLDSPLMISSHAAAQAPSKLGLQPGETISVENAIKAVVTKSANDIACAIAENIGGDERSFARMMTSKAHALGMRDTHYANASGLPDPAQITTAYDLAVLGRAIQDRFPRYYRYFSTHSFTYNGSLHRNHNHLLGRVEGMDGIKTGYTRASGFNLLTSVHRGNHHIVAVVMGGATAASRDQAMARLIEDTIDDGAPVRTAAAITEDVGAVVDEVAEAPAPRHVEHVAMAERTETVAGRGAAHAIDPDETASIEPEEPVAPVHRTPRVAAAPVPTAPIPTPAHVKVEKPAAEKAVRPAFVSGVQKHVAEETTMTRKKTAKDIAKQQLAAAIDGSTSSRPAGKTVTTAAATTPSAIHSTTNVGKTDLARPAKPGWMIQIGAAEDPEKANALLSRARSQLSGFPTTARAFTEKVQKGNETLYRARFAGLEEQSAQSACKTLKKSGFACFPTKN